MVNGVILSWDMNFDEEKKWSLSDDRIEGKQRIENPNNADIELNAFQDDKKWDHSAQETAEENVVRTPDGKWWK